MTITNQQTSLDIVGHYRCEGGDYRGEVTIRDLSDSFAVHWTISGSVHAGVGLRLGNVLAVSIAFPVSAVVLYQIHPGPALHGQYSAFPGGCPVRDEVLSFSHPLRNWQVGDKVLAKWSRDPFWYPATVLELADNEQYCVRFADGDEEWLGRSRLMADLLTVGDMVYHTQGFFHRDESGDYAIKSMDPSQLDTSRIGTPCRIIGRDGETVKLQFDDGVTLKSSVDYIRSMAPREG